MDKNEDFVQLEGPGDWKVPRRWHAGIFVLKTKPGYRLRSGEPDLGMMHGAVASADIEMKGAIPWFTDFHIESAHRPGTFNADDLASVDWEASLENAVWLKAADERLNSGERLHEQGKDEVRRAVRIAQRKNGVTAERLAEVLRLHEKDGIDAVIKETGKSRSYAYQLLARAREELQ